MSDIQGESGRPLRRIYDSGVPAAPAAPTFSSAGDPPVNPPPLVRVQKTIPTPPPAPTPVVAPEVPKLEKIVKVAEEPTTPVLTKVVPTPQPVQEKAPEPVLTAPEATGVPALVRITKTEKVEAAETPLAAIEVPPLTIRKPNDYVAILIGKNLDTEVITIINIFNSKKIDEFRAGKLQYKNVIEETLNKYVSDTNGEIVAEANEDKKILYKANWVVHDGEVTFTSYSWALVKFKVNDLVNLPLYSLF